MTGNDIYKKALALLGYTETKLEPISKRADGDKVLSLINLILCDLKCEEIPNLESEIKISSAKSEALSYGTAMLVALTEGDSSKNIIFTAVYNAKRSAALSALTHISDVMPS